MSSSSLVPASLTLRDVYTALHLIFVRNKNQHSTAKWWKWLSLLRRSTWKLFLSVEGLEKYADAEGIEWDDLRFDDKGRLVDADGEVVRGKEDERMVAEVRHLRTFILPKAYIAFTTVIADTQFAALGVVLVATLARLSDVLKGFQIKDEKGEEENIHSRVLEQRELPASATQPASLEDAGEVISRQPTRAPEGAEPAPATTHVTKRPGEDLKDATMPDFGAPVERENVKTEKKSKLSKRRAGEDDTVSVEASLLSSPKKAKKTLKKTKPKKKKRDAIDDIFGGL